MITRNKTRAIYIHVPFCKSKCPYCDFYSSPRHRAEDVDAYVASLLAEIEQTSGKRISEIGSLVGYAAGGGIGSEETYASWPIETVYLGGGTPSLLSVPQVAEILGKIKACYDVRAGAEISMEVNPATVTAESLAGYRAAGVNRISIGVQSFDDAVLRILGRLHSGQEAAETVRMARQAGFRNISIDLMFGIAGQSIESWSETVKKAIELAPEHVSLYTLEIMDNTRFARDLEKGIYRQTDEEEDRKMYELALDMLEAAGYRQYEISNAAKPGLECRHNMRYWDMGEYIGLGPGASSFVGGVRYANAADVRAYARSGGGDDGDCSAADSRDGGARPEIVAARSPQKVDVHVNTEEDSLAEYMFTGLRRACGIDKSDFAAAFGRELWDVYSGERAEFEEFVREGLAWETAGAIGLTRAGMSVSNKIMLIFV